MKQYLCNIHVDQDRQVSLLAKSPR